MKAVEAYQISEQVLSRTRLDEYMPQIYKGIKRESEKGEKNVFLSFVLDGLPYPSQPLENNILSALEQEGYKAEIIRDFGINISWDLSEDQGSRSSLAI